MNCVHPVFAESTSNIVSEEKEPFESVKRHIVVDVVFPETSIFVEKNGDRVAYASVEVLLRNEGFESFKPRATLLSSTLSSKLSPGETVASACEKWKSELTSLFCPESRGTESPCPEDILHRAGVKEEEMTGIGKKVSPEKYDVLSLFVDFWLEFPLLAPEYGSIAKKSGTEKAFDAFCIRKTGASWDSLPEKKQRNLVFMMRKQLERRDETAGRRR